MNVLFSSVGRRVELVRAFRQSMDSSRTKGKLVGTDIHWLAPALQVVDVPCLVPRCDAPEFPAVIAEICAAHKIDVILPLIDPEIPILSQHRSEITATGARLAVVTEQAVEIAADKWQAYHFFTELGLPTPKSWLPADAAEIPDAAFPVFIKPRRGSAAANTFRVLDRKQLSFFCEYVPDPIIQELLEGPEITTDVLCDFAGEPKAVVSRQRIAVRGGEAIQSVTIPNDSVRDACLTIARQLPARGPITVQCMLQNGVPHFIEINARLGGGLPLAVAAGVDVARLINESLSSANPAKHLAEYETGVYMTRCDESFFIKDSFRDQIQSHHLRS